MQDYEEDDVEYQSAVGTDSSGESGEDLDPEGVLFVLLWICFMSSLSYENQESCIHFIFNKS